MGRPIPSQVSAVARRLPPEVQALARRWLRRSEPAGSGPNGALGASDSDSSHEERFETGLNESRWFHEKVESAREVIRFLHEESWDWEGRRVAEIGCGSGFMSLVLACESGAAEVVGFDINDVDERELAVVARRRAYRDELPGNLRFVCSDPNRLPASDASFDVLVSWSCFEHVAEPPRLAADMRRLLPTGGALFLQLWPFYYSAHGAHLQDWFPEGFVHLVKTDEEIHADLFRTDDVGAPGWNAYKWGEYLTLNKLTLDGLQAALTGADFRIDVVELIAQRTRLPAGLPDLPLSILTTSGVVLLATAV